VYEPAQLQKVLAK